MDNGRLEQMLRDYVERRLLAPRGMAGESFELIKPSTGVRTFVRLVEIEGADGFALRAYPRFQAWRARRRLAAAQLIQTNNLPAPRALDCEFGGWRRGWTFLAEERLRGRHPQKGEWTQGLARSLAETVARFHAVSSERHGPIERPARGSFFSEMMGKARNRLFGVRRRNGGRLSGAQLAAAKRWFASWKDALNGIEHFDLIHDKLNPGNVIWLEEENRFALLDFETLQYGARAKDIVQTEHDVFHEDPTAIAAFHQAYSAEAPHASRQTAHIAYPFFHAYYHLSEASICLKRAQRSGNSPRREHESQKLQGHWAAMEEIIKDEGHKSRKRPKD